MNVIDQELVAAQAPQTARDKTMNIVKGAANIAKNVAPLALAVF